MAKLHELLAAEKTPKAAWNVLLEETKKKFKNTANYFDGHSKSLSMIEDTPANKHTEAQNREDKPVTTTVYDTLEYALDLFGKHEDLQFQKNSTNRQAGGTVMWKGQPLLADVPVDELLGLEARLTELRKLYEDVPTLDATKYWVQDTNTGAHVWRTKHPEETTKTEKQNIPVVLSPATVEHPANVQVFPKDVVIGKFSTSRRSGSATALQKAEALKRVDELIVEIKQARMRANETVVEAGKISDILLPLLLEPFESSVEDHQ